MHRRMVAVVIALALVCGACGARFKDHEEAGVSVGAPAPSGPSPTASATTIGSGETGAGPAPGRH
ncbi:MAG: hypothetical protein QOH28_2559 [Actinomycetota bacterium]|jgi:hypothetical protein|nr:hypothetical protein [Actinomycetota bacterium]